jgi:hypothetical protein
MLDAYVIEEIKRRDRERGREERPAVELPVPTGPAQPSDGGAHRDEDDAGDRGVVIIDYSS